MARRKGRAGCLPVPPVLLLFFLWVMGLLIRGVEGGHTSGSSRSPACKRGTAFCYAPFSPRRFSLPPPPLGLYKTSDDDALSSSTAPAPFPLPPSSSSSSSTSPSIPAAAAQQYVNVEEIAHPLKRRSLARSFSFFRGRVRQVFSSSSSSKKAKDAAAAAQGEKLGKSSSSASPSSSSSPSRPSIWPRLRQICRPEIPLLCVSAVALLAAAMVEVSVPHYSSQALSAILQQKGREEFTVQVTRVVKLGVLAAITTGVRGLCFGLAGTRIVCRLRHALFKSLLTQDIAFFDANQSGELTNRLTADCSKISNVVSLNVNIMLRQSIQLIGGLVYLYRLHRLMALVAGGGLAFIFLVTGIHGKFNRALGEQIQDALAQSNAAAGTSLSLIRVVRTHVGEAVELSNYDRKLKQTVNLMEAHDWGYGTYRLAIRVAQTGLLGAVLGLGWHLTGTGAMTMDQLTSALFYVQFVLGASYDVGDQYSRIQDALGSATQVFSLLDRQPAMSVKPLLASSSLPQQQALSSTTTKPHLLEPPALSSLISPPLGEANPQGAEIVFKDVSFTYPMRPQTPILQGLDLTISPGMRVGVVGASGGGKSTLLRLLARHYDPDGGNVYLDGRDISSFSQEELSHKVAMLSQEPPLLPISLRDNIAYGLKPGTYTDADVIAAAKAANIHSFIESLPQGYNTLVGEGSVGLSGGEKQRVSIARALMRRPRVLLLDEPTSALDAASEAIVQQALDKAAEGRTVLIIAHRLQTIESCDSIIVLKNGVVVERGTHDDLLAKEGVYAALRAQQICSEQSKVDGEGSSI